MMAKRCRYAAGVRCALLAALAAVAATAAGEGDGYRTLAEIESALVPLDVLVDDDGIRHSVDLRIRFEFDSAELAPSAERQIEVLGEALAGPRLAAYDIRIVGHTDARGDAAYNQRLSRERAEAVRRRLLQDHGLDAVRIQAEGKGESELLDRLPPNAAEHRRVEIIAVPAERAAPQHSDDDAIHRGGRAKDTDGGMRVIDW